MSSILVLPRSVNALSQTTFVETFKNEIQSLDNSVLPLQQGLMRSSHVSDSPVTVIILNQSENNDVVIIKTGIQYTGIIAGSCCSDDPTPVDEENEYCELEFRIDKKSGETQVELLS